MILMTTQMILIMLMIIVLTLLMMILLIFGPRLGRIFGNDDDDGDGSTSDDADVNSHANARNFADANPTEGVMLLLIPHFFPLAPWFADV